MPGGNLFLHNAAMFDLPPYPDAVLRGAALSVFALIWIVVFVRLFGLRVFSKMTAFDFVVTLAVGSLLATAAAASSWSGFIQAAIAIIALITAQFVLARLRKSSSAVKRSLENQPLLLMEDGQFIDEALRISRVDRSDVIAKLREANALHFDQVKAVILETTGDISVLHGDQLDPRVLEGVRRV